MENVINHKKVIILNWCFFTIISCTTEKTLFEKDIWWYGHWQNFEETDYFFSIGQKPVGINELITPQFFISTRDSIYSNFHLKNLEEFNHSKEWKIILTNGNKYIKIRAIDEAHIEISSLPIH